MKKLLLLVGITGILGLVSVGTRAEAAIQPTAWSTVSPPSLGDCMPLECDTFCRDEGCYVGICTPPDNVCKCYNAGEPLTLCTK
jgi:hypothetical protein